VLLPRCRLRERVYTLDRCRRQPTDEGWLRWLAIKLSQALVPPHLHSPTREVNATTQIVNRCLVTAPRNLGLRYEAVISRSHPSQHAGSDSQGGRGAGIRPLCRDDHRVVIGQPALRHQISAPADADHVATGIFRTKKDILSPAVYAIA
jgi:hypothetical protein